MGSNRTRTALAGLGMAAALVAPLAGCGGKSKTDQYKTDAKKAADTFKTEAQSASNEIKAAQSKAQVVSGLESLKTSVNHAASQFAALKPPSNAQADNSAMVTQLHSVAGDIDSVEQAVKSNNAGAAKSLLPKVQSDLNAVQSTGMNGRSALGDWAWM